VLKFHSHTHARTHAHTHTGRAFRTTVTALDTKTMLEGKINKYGYTKLVR
jgi:hypothetical protein